MFLSIVLSFKLRRLGEVTVEKMSKGAVMKIATFVMFVVKKEGR